MANQAAGAGLAITDHQLIDFAWLDADNNANTGLLTMVDQGKYIP